MNLHNKSFRVAQTADNGVVSAQTQLYLIEKNGRVLGRYAGGTIERGCLVGARTGATLVFRFAQREAGAQIHAGHSSCELDVLGDGRLVISERFTWETRSGTGVNVFEEPTRK